jgi:hypothetical protein
MSPFSRNKPVTWPNPYCFAAWTGAAGLANGLTFRLRAGDCWASDDPAVVEHPDFFLAEPPPEQWIRTTPDVARQEAASAYGSFAAEVAEADRNAPTSTLIAY